MKRRETTPLHGRCDKNMSNEEMPTTEFKSISSNILENVRQTKNLSCQKTCEECFIHYDKDCDQYLDRKEFHSFLQDLFYNEVNRLPYDLSEELVTTYLTLLDEDQDGKISSSEFQTSWTFWAEQVLKPVTAFVVIDVQNDFIDGKMALRTAPGCQEGLDVIPVINDLLDNVAFDLVVYSKDWHPENHISFINNVHLRDLHSSSKITASDAKALDMVVFTGPPLTPQCLWPEHCVGGTSGAELHPDLKIVENSITVLKGTDSEVDSYSAFWDNNKATETELHSILEQNNVSSVYLTGLAYDVCVGSSAIDALDHGFQAMLIDDACRGVTLAGIDKMQSRIKEAGGWIVDAKEVRRFASGKDRRPEMALHRAQTIYERKRRNDEWEMSTNL